MKKTAQAALFFIVFTSGLVLYTAYTSFLQATDKEPALLLLHNSGTKDFTIEKITTKTKSSESTQDIAAKLPAGQTLELGKLAEQITIKIILDTGAFTYAIKPGTGSAASNMPAKIHALLIKNDKVTIEPKVEMKKSTDHAYTININDTGKFTIAPTASSLVVSVQ